MATYRFFDGAAGRPGAGSSSGVVLPSAPSPYSGNYGTGIVFVTSQGGCWFEGYWWYVPFGGQTTSGATFALWEVSGASAGALVTGSGVTAGTLTAASSAGNANGWNFIQLTTPLQLSQGVAYTAAIAYSSTAGFPQQKNVFGSGDTFSAGITNGPIAAYSSSSGSFPVLPQGATGGAWQPQSPYQTGTANASGAGGMPTVNDADDILWLDVSISTTPPPNYTIRLWPSYPSVYGLTANSVDNSYTLCTQFNLSAAAELVNIWFNSPGGTQPSTILPSQCGIFSVATGLIVPGTLKTSPSWSGAAASGWVSCSYAGAGIYLPPGDYQVAVYGAGAGTNRWYGAVIPYWNSGGFGVSGLSNGVLAAPNDAGSAVGQSSYHGPGDTSLTYPNVDGAGENYFVDLELNPLPAPDIPLGLPRVPHPQPQRVTAGHSRVAAGVRGLLNHAAAAIPTWKAQPRRPGPQRARAGSRGLCAAGIAGAVAVAVTGPAGTPPRAYPVSHPQPHRVIARGVIGPGNHSYALPPGPRPRTNIRPPQRALVRGVTGPSNQAVTALPLWHPQPRSRPPLRVLWRGQTGSGNQSFTVVAVGPPGWRPLPRRTPPQRAIWRGLTAPAPRPGPAPQRFLPPRIVAPHRALWRGNAGRPPAVPGVAVPPPRLLRQPPRRVPFARALWRAIFGQPAIGGQPLEQSLLSGTITPAPWGGTVTTQAYAGSVTPAPWGATLTTLPYSGTITGGIVGVQIDLSGASATLVNNTAYYYLALTYNGAPLNLTGYTLKAYQKATRLTPDSEAEVYTTSSGLTITNVAGGLVTWVIPLANTGNPTTMWYRVDVIDASGEVFTALYGSLQVLPA